MGEKINNDQVLILRKHIVSRVNIFFPKRRPLSYPNLIKIMNENVRKVLKARKFKPKIKHNRTTTEVSPWNDQLTGFGAQGSPSSDSLLSLLSGFSFLFFFKLVLQDPNLTLSFCSDSQLLVNCSVIVVKL